jgi:hypothetical protein
VFLGPLPTNQAQRVRSDKLLLDCFLSASVRQKLAQMADAAAEPPTGVGPDALPADGGRRRMQEDQHAKDALVHEADRSGRCDGKAIATELRRLDDLKVRGGSLGLSVWPDVPRCCSQPVARSHFTQDSPPLSLGFDRPLALGAFSRARFVSRRRLTTNTWQPIGYIRSYSAGRLDIRSLFGRFVIRQFMRQALDTLQALA